MVAHFWREDPRLSTACGCFGPQALVNAWMGGCGIVLCMGRCFKARSDSDGLSLSILVAAAAVQEMNSLQEARQWYWLYLHISRSSTE